MPGPSLSTWRADASATSRSPVTWAVVAAHQPGTDVIGRDLQRLIGVGRCFGEVLPQDRRLSGNEQSSQSFAGLRQGSVSDAAPGAQVARVRPSKEGARQHLVSNGIGRRQFNRLGRGVLSLFVVNQAEFGPRDEH